MLKMSRNGYILSWLIYYTGLKTETILHMQDFFYFLINKIVILLKLAYLWIYL